MPSPSTYVRRRLIATGLINPTNVCAGGWKDEIRTHMNVLTLKAMRKASVMYSLRNTFMKPQNMCFFTVPESGSKCWNARISTKPRINGDWTNGETLLDQVRCPVVIGKGRAFLKRQVGHLGGLDDERVEESEERERQP